MIIYLASIKSYVLVRDKKMVKIGSDMFWDCIENLKHQGLAHGVIVDDQVINTTPIYNINK